MSDSPTRFAPGWPGIPPRWTSSAKSGAGTALNQHSKVWFTMSHGILNEIYFPRVDQACTRDMGFIVTDGRGFFSEEKRHCTFESQPIEPGVPVYELTNTENNNRYRIYKEILTDPYRNVVLQNIRFEPLQGSLADYRLYALLSPHLANCGDHNTGWVGDYKGVPMFFAERDGTALAFASSVPWKKMSIGFVGTSDGWQDLSQHYEMEWEYQRAENGNIACTGEIDLAACNGKFALALGFGACGRRPANRPVPVCLKMPRNSAVITLCSGRIGRTLCSNSTSRRARTIFIAPRPQCCARTSRRIFWAESSPASRFPGALIKAMKISAVIT